MLFAKDQINWGRNASTSSPLGKDFGVWHKAWAQRWHPSQTGWEPLNGSFL